MIQYYALFVALVAFTLFGTYLNVNSGGKVFRRFTMTYMVTGGSVASFLTLVFIAVKTFGL
jgi:hypothetical protein